MFVTLYSYKGGVGRSLALANIACLMACDPQHPQRVLVWDFDLEAPGLHRLFPPRQPQRYGFVDLAYEYATSGTMPSVEEYLYESEVPGVWVLPAGKVGETYCAKLQAIDWLRFFGEDPRDPGPFFGSLVRSIRNTSNPFDYVLIDSRTGLNDQAGICTLVLADLLVVLFRLTQQNLDGLEHLIPAFRSQFRDREKGSTEIYPVASQVRAGTSPGQIQARQAALKIFGKDLEYVRFDEDLVAKERLLCLPEELDNMWPCPPVVDDYKRISDHIRDRNTQDTRTQTQQLRLAMNQGDTATATTILLKLLPRRPNLQAGWMALSDLLDRGISEVRAREFNTMVSKILHADVENSFAHQWKAAFRSSKALRPTAVELKKARASLVKACNFAPEPQKGSILRSLATIASVQGDHRTAVKSLREAQTLLPKNNQVALDLAMLHMRMGARYFALAVEELEEIPAEIADEKAATLAYLLAFLGEHERAQKALAACDKRIHSLTKAHYLLIERKNREAVAFAEERLSASSETNVDLSNWVEFYICAGEFQNALKVAEVAQESSPIPRDTLVCLVDLARFLINRCDSGSKEADDLAMKWGKLSWNFRELLIFRERSIRDQEKYAGSLDIIEKLIQFQELNRITTHGVGLLRQASRLRMPRLRIEFVAD